MKCEYITISVTNSIVHVVGVNASILGQAYRLVLLRGFKGAVTRCDFSYNLQQITQCCKLEKKLDVFYFLLQLSTKFVSCERVTPSLQLPSLFSMSRFLQVARKIASCNKSLHR